MGIISKLVALSALCSLAAAWLPYENKNVTSSDGTNLFLTSNGKIRGVNLGSQFIFEPWIGPSAWSDMGCGNTGSEFDCVDSLGQDAANSAFAKHWDSWITQDDISQMVSYGLNTIRVPVGYWLREDLVYTDSEHFPQGGLDYVKKLCGWASDAGLYIMLEVSDYIRDNYFGSSNNPVSIGCSFRHIIMDLHGAPGAQTPNNAFTGQLAPEAGFYVDYQYERALKWLEWMTGLIHTTNEFRNVGMLEIVNEPVQTDSQASSMRQNYYPQAFNRIRANESSAGIDKTEYLHIQMMDELWGSGDPDQYIDDLYYAAYDDHRYLKWDTSVDVSHDSYISESCNDNRDSNWPTIVGEWSLAVPDDVQSSSDWDPSSNVNFYTKWFAAQVHSYEKQQGWVFWTWKAQLNDYRWSYQDAVNSEVIPKDLNSLESVC